MTESKEVNQNQPGPVRNASREETDRAEYWDDIYAEAEGAAPGWDLGEANPELSWQLENAQPAIAPGRIIVPGCGYGHDLILLARRGFEVIGVDISPRAVEGANRRMADERLSGRALLADYFALGPEHAGQYDYLYEYTCFCAIHPERRREYAEAATRLLKPNGQLIGCFYHHRNPGGPPFDTNPDQVREAFIGLFELRTLVYAQHSVERRQGKELWARFWNLRVDKQ